MKEFRFKFSTATMFFYIFGFKLWQIRYMMKHADRYSLERRFKGGIEVMNAVRRHANTKTYYFGTENLRSDETVVYYANHQGKYDAHGILLGIRRPTSVLWEKKKADIFLGREMAFLCDAVMIDLESMKGKATGIIEAIEKIKNGQSMLIFPEGKWDTRNKNEVQEFQAGCMSCSLKTKTTIIPVAIYDSYKALGGNNIFYRARTQVHYLEPIKPEEYEGLSKQELASMVQSRIEEKMKTLKSI